MNEQENFWANEYAQEYIRKNQDFDLELGVEAWRKMLAPCSDGIASVLECGCNIGRNISLLNAVLPSAQKSIIEVSQPAFEFVTRNYDLQYSYNGPIENCEFKKNFDLVFTMGVLIHVHPGNLEKNMRKIFDYSSNYILIGEYFNRTPVSLDYQGQKDLLFKRDFGKFFMEHFPVKLVDYGFLWGHIYDAAGFDDITYWLFKK